jgi:hypothetical protein
MNIEATKLELIKLIADEQSERLLEQVRLFFKKSGKKEALISKAAKDVNKAITENKKDSSGKPPINDADQGSLKALASQPTPQSIDLEQLKKEQGYDTMKMAAHFRTLDRVAWKDENVAELLEILRH